VWSGDTADALGFEMRPDPQQSWLRSHAHRASPAILALVAALVLLGIPGTIASDDGEDQTPGLRAGSSVTLENESLRILAFADGTWVMGTTGGDPGIVGDEGKSLLFGYPSHSGSGYPSLRIVTADDVRDYNLAQTLPAEGPSQKADRVVTRWEIGGVHVERELSFYLNPFSDRSDVVLMRYCLGNTTGRLLRVGVREMLDVMIGANDEAPFFLPGIGALSEECDYLGDAVPEYFKSFESSRFSEDSLRGLGIVRGYGMVAPDRFALATWHEGRGAGKGVYGTVWDYEVTPNAELGDSAVALWWGPYTVAPGGERCIQATYGLGGAGGGDAWFDAPTTLDCQSSAFAAHLWVSNTSAEPLLGGTAALRLSPGLSLGPGQADTWVIGNIEGKQVKGTSWRIEVDARQGQRLAYSASVGFSNAPGIEAQAEILVATCARTPSPTITPADTPLPMPTPTPTPVVICYCSGSEDLIYAIDKGSFKGYTTRSASMSSLIHVTAPPAPADWNQAEFTAGDSWSHAAAVKWDEWDAPDWGPLISGCSIVGLVGDGDRPKGASGETHLLRRTFFLTPPETHMRVAHAILEMWSDNKTAWWWQGELVADDREGYVGQVELYPVYVRAEGGAYVLAVQNSNDLLHFDHNPHDTAYRMCVTWGYQNTAHTLSLPLILAGMPGTRQV